MQLPLLVRLSFKQQRHRALCLRQRHLTFLLRGRVGGLGHFPKETDNTHFTSLGNIMKRLQQTVTKIVVVLTLRFWQDLSDFLQSIKIMPETKHDGVQVVRSQVCVNCVNETNSNGKILAIMRQTTRSVLNSFLLQYTSYHCDG